MEIASMATMHEQRKHIEEYNSGQLARLKTNASIALTHAGALSTGKTIMTLIDNAYHMGRDHEERATRKGRCARLKNNAAA